MNTRFALLFVGTVALSGCSFGGEPAEPIFGTADTACDSAVLTNDDDDEVVLNETLDCFLDNFNEGTPITVDFRIPTTEGDPTFVRLEFDGDTVLIVEDTRRDRFGPSTLFAQRCEGLRETNWLPVGENCTTTRHDGFPDVFVG